MSSQWDRSEVTGSPIGRVAGMQLVKSLVADETYQAVLRLERRRCPLTAG